jgi:hypothetical protein
VNDLKPFDTIFVSSDLGYRKPDPEAFNLVARNMGFEPREVLFSMTPRTTSREPARSGCKLSWSTRSLMSVGHSHTLESKSN